MEMVTLAAKLSTTRRRKSIFNRKFLIMVKKFMLHSDNVSFDAWLMLKNSELGYPVLGTDSYTSPIPHPIEGDGRIICLVEVENMSLEDQGALLDVDGVKALGWFNDPEGIEAPE